MDLNESQECLTTVQQVFLHYQVGSLLNYRASKPYALVGHIASRLVLDPLAILLLDNRLCMCCKSFITNFFLLC